MEELRKKENYIADTPIFIQNEDKFQRFNFSRRIANTIIQRKDSSSLVIGIYGNWGEGKTSVINFVEDCLATSEDIIVFKFNPWRFTDETQLLSGFFHLLAKKLDKSIQSKGEKIGELICDYGEAVSPTIHELKTGGVFKFFRKKFSVNIDEQKKRIENILNQEKKKIVVFIDDIDRLDKKEIQSVFKLVKLTGDFSFTTYVLAFDETMVAKAIGEIYEDGSETAGRSFLEKIIQVPLRLPQAQKNALRDYCFDKINNALSANGISASEDESRRFVQQFKNLLPRLNTPRMAIRLGNSISFALPVLNKEVNLGDLMLIESIKVFYPDLYIFIRDNSSYFIQGYDKSLDRDYVKSENRKKIVKEAFDAICSKYSNEEHGSIKELLTELFPLFRGVFQSISFGEGSYQKWHEEKRIGSPQYFMRYFAYTVIEGEISDVEYEKFIENVSNVALKERESEISNFLSNIDTGALAMKMLLFKAEKYPPNVSEKLIQVFAKYGEKFSFNRNSVFGIDTPVGQLAYLAYKLLKNISDTNLQLTIANNFISESPFILAYEFSKNLKRRNSKEQDDEAINEQHFDKLMITLLEKAKSDCGDQPLFEKFPHEAAFLMSHVWSPILGKDNIMTYIKPILVECPSKTSSLIKVYAPFVYSSGSKFPYFGEINNEIYNWIQKTLDVDFIYEMLQKSYGNIPDFDIFPKYEGELTDDERAKQFMYFYGISLKKLSDSKVIDNN